MLFIAAAMLGAILIVFPSHPAAQVEPATFQLARAMVYNIVNVYMIKMEAVFMISTSTVALVTRFAPRWLAIAGYVLALLLILGSSLIVWSFAVFPVWIFLLSGSILIDSLREPTEDDDSD